MIDESKVEYKVITTVEQVKEIEPLAKKSYEEAETRSAKLIFDLDISAIMRLLEKGDIEALGAYYNDTLIGYVAGHVAYDIYNKEMIVEIFSIYVDNEYRESGVAETMLYAYEDMLFDLGSATFLMSFPENSPAIFAEKAGYQAKEIRYQKVIVSESIDSDGGS